MVGDPSDCTQLTVILLNGYKLEKSASQQIISVILNVCAHMRCTHVIIINKYRVMEQHTSKEAVVFEEHPSFWVLGLPHKCGPGYAL